jgi:hypothetical protein
MSDFAVPKPGNGNTGRGGGDAAAPATYQPAWDKRTAHAETIWQGPSHCRMDYHATHNTGATHIVSGGTMTNTIQQFESRSSTTVAAEATGDQDLLARLRMRPLEKPFYVVDEFARLADGRHDLVMEWIRDGKVESMLFRVHGEDLEPVIPATELSKLFLGELGVTVAPEIIESELGPGRTGTGDQ